MKIRIDIDDDALRAYRRWSHRGALKADILEDILEKVAQDISEPGVVDGKIEMTGFGPVGTWERS